MNCRHQIDARFERLKWEFPIEDKFDSLEVIVHSWAVLFLQHCLYPIDNSTNTLDCAADQLNGG